MKMSKIICFVPCMLLLVSALFSACGKESSKVTNTPNMQDLTGTENFVSMQQTQQPLTNTTETNPTKNTDNSKVKTDEKQQTSKSQSNLNKEDAVSPVNMDNISFTLEGIAALSADKQERTSGGIIVRSYDELKATVDYDEFTDCTYYNKAGRKYTGFMNAYNAAFFEKKALIIVYDISTGGTYSANPTRIKTQGTQAAVTLTKQKTSDGLWGTADIQYLRYFISVDKDEIAGIKTVTSTKV